jgi:hypothetical protein
VILHLAGRAADVILIGRRRRGLLKTQKIRGKETRKYKEHKDVVTEKEK